ncbi:DnaJ subfamily C member 9 [Portunus trituberculatus]|uniref:DnaJ subfamily C member 9 n=1 Tax=Portunus trituberculatus TaxID=210409 RepID=A0A5B7J0H5_PORTR|nr:DnaJ subfamily C member 9 [Portunus trituberculatus]
MDYILTNVLCCTIDDEPRFTKILQGWIKEKEVPKFDSFTKESKKKKESRKRKVSVGHLSELSEQSNCYFRIIN